MSPTLRRALLVSLVIAWASFAPAQSRMEWGTDSTNRFVSVHGRHSALFGYPETGLEVWAYPVQILRSFTLHFRPEGTTSEVDARTLLRRIVYAPESITRIYAGPDFVVREKLFVPLDEAGAIISYETESSRPIDVLVEFVPVLDLMWPAAIGGQETLWDSAASSYVISEPTHRFTASIGSPDIVSHDETHNFNRPANDSSSVAFTLRVQPHRVSRVIIAGSKSIEDVNAIASKLLASATALEKSATDHYSDLENHALEIETPDPEVNRALAWSAIALDQAWVCNPALGCGMVAGYGPSRRARRPQYDWFFAGDGLVAVHGLLAEGEYDRARQELEFIMKYQDPNTGMIWHELAQSAAELDWKNYPYMFLHVDLSFEFLNAIAEYYSITGDADFVKSHWNSIQAAHQYCRSLVENDGLPHIPSEKRGQREQDALSDELALSVNWLTASQAFATLAAATDHADLAQESRMTADKLGPVIVQRYWDKQQNSWITGYTRSGVPLQMQGIGPVSVLEQLSLSNSQRDSILDELASSTFQTDWGTRGNGSNSASYDPNSYANGSVWAVGTSGAAAAFWKEHRPVTAFSTWSALLPWTSLDSLGHIHETLAGDLYHEELESVPEQTWSSSSLLSSAVQGLLGLEIDGAESRVTVAPHLPFNWDQLTLKHVRAGKSELSISMAQTENEVRVQIQNEGPTVKFLFAPEIPLGAKLGTAKLGTRPIAATLEQHPQDSHAKVEFDLARGSTSLTINYTGGVAVIPDLPHPMLGDVSQAIKIISTALQGRTFIVNFDYTPSAGSSFNVRTPWNISDVKGGTMQAITHGLYRCKIKPDPEPQDPSAYHHGTVSFTLNGPA